MLQLSRRRPDERRERGPETATTPILTRDERRHLDALERRADHLASRVAAAGPERDDLQYDRQELTALRWAIGLLGGPIPPRLILVRRRS